MRLPLNILILLIFIFLTPKAKAAEGKVFDSSIQILVSASLTNKIQPIIRDYSKIENISIGATFKSPADLANDIRNGEPADLIIFEHSNEMRDLQRQGLIDVFSKTNLFSDSLVLVVSKKFRLKDEMKNKPLKEALLTLKKSFLIIADPEFDPAGVYAKQSLDNLKIYNDVKNNIIRSNSTRNALYLAYKGEGAAIVYKSDIIGNDMVEVIAEIPDNIHDEIIYQGAVVASENMQVARKFLEFLKQNIN
jgi:molybdate transport system substrate-binding protein